MASVKKGTLTASPQCWKHLREWKQFFWKSERQAQKQLAKHFDQVRLNNTKF